MLSSNVSENKAKSLRRIISNIKYGTVNVRGNTIKIWLLLLLVVSLVGTLLIFELIGVFDSPEEEKPYMYYDKSIVPEARKDFPFVKAMEGRDPFSLYLTVWSTDASTWKPRHDRLLESVFVHDPDAVVAIVSNTLPPDFFEEYVQNGYSIFIQRMPYDKMVSSGWYLGPISKLWISRYKEWSVEPFFYSHITDYIRFVMLYHYGGTYLDMDAIILRPFMKYDFIGVDKAKPPGKCHWCFPREGAPEGAKRSDDYLAPGVMRMQKGRLILVNAVENAFDDYNPECWGCVGPTAITVAYINAKPDEKKDFHTLPSHMLYPAMFDETPAFFKMDDHAQGTAMHIMKHAISLHLFGKMTNHLIAEPHSVADYIFHRFSMDVRKVYAYSREQAALKRPEMYVYSNSSMGLFKGYDVVFLACPFAGLSFDLEVVARKGHVLFNQGSGSKDALENGRDNADDGSADQLGAHGVSVKGISSLSRLNQKLGSMRYLPNDDMHDGYDTLSITIKTDSFTVKEEIPVAIFSRLVTLVTKTMSRWNKVEGLIRSFWDSYPNSKVLVASEPPPEGAVPVKSISRDIKSSSLFRVTDLEYDAGLSVGRNTLVRQAETDYILYVDDDFEFGNHSYLDVLLEQAVRYDADIAAGIIPEDIAAYNNMFAGTLFHNESALVFESGYHQRQGACFQVDVVPNTFIAKRSGLLKVMWDDELKMGEHEDFLIRAKQAKLAILHCPFSWMHHNPSTRHHYFDGNRSKVDVYEQRRLRSIDFIRKAMKKHGLKRYISFGYEYDSLKME